MYLAISAADRALQEDPSLPEARFNLALALEKAALCHQARRAWGAYLQVDSRSGWANEAREHLKRLRKPSPRQNWQRRWREKARRNDPLSIVPYNMYQIAREDATEEILGRWSILLSEGRKAEAQKELELAQRIGSHFLGTHDKTVPDAVKAILTATEVDKTTSLREAHRNYMEGMRNLQDGRADLARSNLESAADLFASAEGPLEYWAELALAEIAHHEGDFQLVARLIGKTRSKANLARYPALNRRLFWIEGLSRLSRANLKGALAAFQSADRGSPGMEDRELGGAVGLRLAETLRGLGEFEWVYRNVALGDLSSYPNSPYLGMFFRDLGSTFSEDQPRLALRFLNESLEIAWESADPSDEVQLHLDRSLLEKKIGMESEAARDFLVASQKLKSLQDLATRRRLKAQVDVARCQVFDETNPAECVSSVDWAIKVFSLYDRRRLPELYNLREGYSRRRADSPEVEKDLLKSIEFYEGRLQSSHSPPLFRFPEAKRSLDELTKLYLLQGDPGRALEVQERGRAVALPLPLKTQRRREIGGYSGVNLRPFSAQEFSTTMPNSATLVEYQVDNDHLAAWIFRGNTVRRIKLAATRQQLVKHVGYTPSKGGRLIDGSFASQDLSRWLLKPIRSWLPVTGDLLFLLDPIFDHVDFARLKHPTTGRSLFQDLGVGEIPKPDSGFTLKGNLSAGLTLLRRTLAWQETLEAVAPVTGRSYLPTASIIRSLPGHAVLVEYAFVGDRLNVWTVFRGEVRFHSRPSRRAQILGSVEELSRRWISQGAGATKLLEDLYRELIPVGLPQHGELIIVPDDVLARVPFAALRNPLSGKYLVEEHSLSMSPSAGLYLKQSDRLASSRLDHGGWSFLAVSNPSSDGERHSWLSGAASETERIRHLFPGTEVISGRDSNGSPSATMAGKHKAIHFAGHWNSLYPSYSGALGAAELPIGDQVRLVVLAACSTASNGLRAQITDLGLAEPLLARGVPAVITSLWDVEDEATSRLFIRFYDHFHAGDDGASALRAAQIDLLHGEDVSLRDPSKWAGFQLIGFGGI